MEGNCSTTVGSWLTRMTVFPWSVDRDRRSFVMATVFSVSRVAGRFVGEDEGGIIGQREGDRDPLLLPSTQLLRAFVPLLPHAHHGEQPLGPGQSLRCWHAENHHGHLQVFEGRHARNQVEELKNETHLL